MLKLLRKLANSTPTELLDRTRQATERYLEWAGIRGRLPTGRRLLDHLGANDEIAFFQHFHTRAGAFFPSFDELNGTVELFCRLCPEQQRSLIEKADRICEGNFDLLGHKNLYFQDAIPNWHFDPISGQSTPLIHWSRISQSSQNGGPDKKVIWELNRHQYFLTLGQAFVISGDEKYADQFVRHLSNWMDTNPPKIGVNWVSSLELAFRAMSWIWAFHFFRDSKALTPVLFARASQFLYLHASHIEAYLSTYFSPNTHLTGEALGLFFLGTFFEQGSEGGKWKAHGHKILMDALSFQVREDGVYCEQSSHYQRYTIDFYSTFLTLTRSVGEVPDKVLLTRLWLMYDFLLYIMEPNGKMPLFGDDDGGRLNFLDDVPPNDIRPTLTVGAALLERGDLKSFSDPDSLAEMIWLLGEKGWKALESVKSQPPMEHYKAFDKGGFYTYRTSWEKSADHILINCGPHGFLNGGHAHADCLSFIFDSRGLEFLVDPGTYTYDSDVTMRNQFRSTAYHNCLTVNGISSSQPAGPFSWHTKIDGILKEWSVNEDGFIFRGSHNGFAHLGVDYEREIKFTKNGALEITEFIDSRERNNFEVNLIFAPQWLPQLDPGAVEATAINIFSIKNGNLAEFGIYSELIGSGMENAGSWSVHKSQVSQRFGRSDDSYRAVFSVAATGKLVIRTLIRPLNIK